MPQLPTIRVIGSHAISTRLPSCSAPGPLPSLTCVAIRSVSSPIGPVAGVDVTPRMAPLRFLVDGALGDAPQRTEHRAGKSAGAGGHPAARRLVHERHELVGEPGHRA